MLEEGLRSPAAEGPPVEQLKEQQNVVAQQFATAQTTLQRAIADEAAMTSELAGAGALDGPEPAYGSFRSDARTAVNPRVRGYGSREAKDRDHSVSSAQRDHRIDARGAAGRNEAREEPHGREHRHHPAKRRRIGSRDSKRNPLSDRASAHDAGMPSAMPHAASERACRRFAAAHRPPKRQAPFGSVYERWCGFIFAGVRPQVGRLGRRRLTWGGGRPAVRESPAFSPPTDSAPAGRRATGPWGRLRRRPSRGGPPRRLVAAPPGQTRDEQHEERGKPRERRESGDITANRAGVRRRVVTQAALTAILPDHRCLPLLGRVQHFVVGAADLRTLKRPFHLQPKFPAESMRDDVARRLERPATAQLVDAKRVTDGDRFTVPVAALQDVGGHAESIELIGCRPDTSTGRGPTRNDRRPP